MVSGLLKEQDNAEKNNKNELRRNETTLDHIHPSLGQMQIVVGGGGWAADSYTRPKKVNYC